MNCAIADWRLAAPGHDLIAERMQARGSWKGMAALKCGQLELCQAKVT